MRPKGHGLKSQGLGRRLQTGVSLVITYDIIVTQPALAVAVAASTQDTVAFAQSLITAVNNAGSSIFIDATQVSVSQPTIATAIEYEVTIQAADAASAATAVAAVTAQLTDTTVMAQALSAATGITIAPDDVVGGAAVGQSRVGRPTITHPVWRTNQHCVGAWSDCAFDCTQTYVITTAQVGSGINCETHDTVVRACSAGVGECPVGPSVDCVGGWSDCDSGCLKQFSVATPASGLAGMACESDTVRVVGTGSQSVWTGPFEDAEKSGCSSTEGQCPGEATAAMVAAGECLGSESTCDADCLGTCQTCSARVREGECFYICELCALGL